MSYIVASDIKSNLVSGFDIEEYIEESDLEVNDVAEKLGIRDTSLISTPVHYKIKRYAIVFVQMRLAQDKRGTASQDVALDKYRDQQEMYEAELKRIYPQLTYEMFTGTVNSQIGRTATNEFYRG